MLSARLWTLEGVANLREMGSIIPFLGRKRGMRAEPEERGSREQESPAHERQPRSKRAGTNNPSTALGPDSWDGLWELVFFMVSGWLKLDHKATDNRL